MPDVHLGIGATIGSVVATQGAICPAAVGVDIGCGMLATKLLENPELIKENTSKIRASIERSVPVGFESNRKPTKAVEEWIGWKKVFELSHLSEKLKNIALHQLGSLGGGNHFIELCEDEEGNIWLMLHSGSRNIGKTLAEMHINKAKDEMKRFFIDLPDPDLAYFVEDKPDFIAYVNDLY
jgi:tRNA-splicing ligase RtcB (3'-phosphate/5'-hydroxy nucleic acid ligase)